MADGDFIVGYYYFNPSDYGIIERYDKVIAVLENLDKDLGADDTANILKEQMDFLLGTEVSKTLFDKVSPIALTEDGDFFFEEVMSGVIDLVDEFMSKRLKKKEAKIKKAVDKYKVN
mgnify:CR=1 FL=1